MIQKILIEPEDAIKFSSLPKERKEKYDKIHHRLACCPEEYIIGVDISNSKFNDYSVVLTFQINNEGKYEFIKQEIF